MRLHSGFLFGELSVLYVWEDEEGHWFGIQQLKDKSFCVVDSQGRKIQSLTLEEARKLKAEIGKPDLRKSILKG